MDRGDLGQFRRLILKYEPDQLLLHWSLLVVGENNAEHLIRLVNALQRQEDELFAAMKAVSELETQATSDIYTVADVCHITGPSEIQPVRSGSRCVDNKK